MHLFDDSFANRVYRATYTRYPHIFLAAIHAHDGMGSCSLSWGQDEEAFISIGSAEYDAAIAELRSLKSLNEETWSPRAFLHDVLRIAQTDFAVIDCRSDRREDSLTGSLMTRIWTAAALLNSRALGDVSRPSSNVCLIELIGHNLEQETGGDVALVHHDGNWQFAFCLQAKRTDHRRKPQWIGKGWTPTKGKVLDMPQLLKLRELEANCPAIRGAYLLYDRGIIREVILPLVKPIDALEDDILQTGCTDLSTGTSDLASFVTSTLRDVADGGGTSVSLDDLANFLAKGNIRYVLSCSIDQQFGPDLAHQLRQALEADSREAKVVHAEASLPGPQQVSLPYPAPRWAPRPKPWRPSTQSTVGPKL
ncbi:hypothetical protein [Muricoccus nepalensis]|uniref:hypothetical protein n=1 Tax=Muricoccus nepalensis TaxID=1854500 RepID=UPI0011295DF0|nr:hypothetical protein [Roseomonas nepalensis]